MKDREKSILSLIRNNPYIQQHEIANILGIARSSVAGHIMSLTQKGFIKGKGYILSENNHIVVIGSANMDVTGYSSNKLILEDSNPGKIKCTPGGVGRNIAENLALLEQECYLISMLGDDFYGMQLLEHTRKTGVNFEHCHIVTGGNTSTYLTVMDDNREMMVAINDMKIIEKLTPSLLSESKGLIHHAKLLIIDCNLSEDTLIWIFSHSGDVPIFVDTVSAFKAHKIKNCLSKIHTIKPNRYEAEAISGIKINNDDDLYKVVAWFHKQGVKRVAISSGIKGVYYSDDNGKQGWSKPLPTSVVNVTGAGDAMLAGIAFGYLNNFSFAESIRFGQACSALTLACDSANNPNLSINNVQNILESNS
ncbi:PfkB family carbohydrate kinase [Orbaceae bacterium ac157xtp]